MADITADLEALIQSTCADEVKQAVASLSQDIAQPVIDNWVANGTFHRDVWDVQMEPLKTNDNTFFLCIMSFFIYYMEAGFMLLEVGVVRTKNVTNSLIKNLSYSWTQAIGFWLTGYAIGWGKSANSMVGDSWWAFKYSPEMPDYAFWTFQYVFAITAGSVVTGAIAERAQITGYLIYSVYLSAIPYPFLVHWAWNPEGWLKMGANYTINGESVNVGFQDFAGSGVVHACGGASTIIYLILLGPRIGRFKENGEVVEMPAHSLTMVVIGALALYNGFLGFNAIAQTTISHPGDYLPIAKAAANSIISTSGGYMCELTYYRVVHKRWLLLPPISGGVAGCVAACATCNIVEGWAALTIGILAGFMVIFLNWLLLKCQIDDVVEAFPVHFGGGVVGVISLAFFHMEDGIFYAKNKQSALFLGWQICGLVVISAWTMLHTYFLCVILKLFNLLRVDMWSELAGLDYAHGHEPAYPPWAFVKEDYTQEDLNAEIGNPKTDAEIGKYGAKVVQHPPPGFTHAWPGPTKDWSLWDLSSIALPVRRRKPTNVVTPAN